MSLRRRLFIALLRGAATVIVCAAALGAGRAGADPRWVWLRPARAESTGFWAGLVALGPDGAVSEQPPPATKAAEAKLVLGPPIGPVHSYWVVPDPQASTVSLIAGEDAERALATIDVGPSTARIALIAPAKMPVKGVDKTIDIEVSLLDAKGRPDLAALPPVIKASSGAIQSIRSLGEGRYQASYRLSDDLRPEVALIVAHAPWPHPEASEGPFRALALRIASSVLLTGTTEPSTEVWVTIGGVRFGPKISDLKGRFQLQVTVPPGVMTGMVMARDRFGATTEREIQLQVPPLSPLGCMAAPRQIPSDGRSTARLLCAASDRAGRPLAEGVMRASAVYGTVEGPRSLGQGIFEWGYHAPRRRGGVDPIRFDLSGPVEASTLLQLELLELPPVRATVSVEPSPILVGSMGRVVVETFDALGRVAPATVQLQATRGQLGKFEEVSLGRQVASYRPPFQLGDWRDRLVGHVVPPLPGPPARLLLATKDWTLTVRAVDALGAPAPGVVIEAGGARVTTSNDGLAHFPLPEPGEVPIQTFVVRAVSRASLDRTVWLLAAGRFVFPPADPIETLEIDRPVAVGPSTQVDLQIDLETSVAGAPPTLVIRAVDRAGGTLTGRAIDWRIEGPRGRIAGTAHPQPDGTIRVELPYGTVGTLRISVIDRTTQTSAALEATL